MDARTERRLGMGAALVAGLAVALPATAQQQDDARMHDEPWVDVDVDRDVRATDDWFDDDIDVDVDTGWDRDTRTYGIQERAWTGADERGRRRVQHDSHYPAQSYGIWADYGGPRPPAGTMDRRLGMERQTIYERRVERDLYDRDDHRDAMRADKDHAARKDRRAGIQTRTHRQEVRTEPMGQGRAQLLGLREAERTLGIPAEDQYYIEDLRPADQQRTQERYYSEQQRMERDVDVRRRDQRQRHDREPFYPDDPYGLWGDYGKNPRSRAYDRNDFDTTRDSDRIDDDTARDNDDGWFDFNDDRPDE